MPARMLLIAFMIFLSLRDLPEPRVALVPRPPETSPPVSLDGRGAHFGFRGAARVAQNYNAPLRANAGACLASKLNTRNGGMFR